MNVPNEMDLAMTDDGDLLFYSHDENEIINYQFVKEIGKEDLVIQNIKNRIKTTKPDWFYDHIGANIEEIIGMENSKETALYGAELIKSSLTEGGYINEYDVYIKPVPTDIFSIMYLVAVRIADDNIVQFKVSVALNAGINVEEAI